jgi:hypothetical protein
MLHMKMPTHAVGAHPREVTMKEGLKRVLGALGAALFLVQGAMAQ